MQTLKGIPVSSGITMGVAQVIDKEQHIIREYDLTSEKQIDLEIKLFRDSIKRTQEDLMSVRDIIKKHVGQEQSKIIDSHITILSDVAIIDKTEDIINKDKKNAAYAFKKTVEDVINTFKQINNEYLQEKVHDIRDIYNRVMNHLLEDFKESRGSIVTKEKVIFVANSISPYEFVHFERGNISGLVTEVGGRTSHVSIIARSLEIPTVIGCEDISITVKTGQYLIIDGNKGFVIIDPDEKTIKKYERIKKQYLDKEQRLLRLKDLPSITIDGKRIDISANIELPSELNVVIDHGCKNIGLCRTEFLYLLSNRLPSEQEQYNIYKGFLEKMNPGYVVIRTIDLGGDKVTRDMSNIKTEANPAMGFRAVRMCLDNKSFFATQIRAILRASAHGNLKIMFPMITTIEELREVLKILKNVKSDLKQRNIPFDEDIETGIMIEVPSAAYNAEIFAKEVDFFSIGTNDLTQFMLAVDRGNKKVAHLFDTHNPAVLKIIRHVTKAAHNNGIWVGVCGEMAANPLSALLLLGIGVDELSMNSLSVLEIKRIIRSITYDEIRNIVDVALKLETSSKINTFLKREFKKKISTFNPLVRTL